MTIECNLLNRLIHNPKLVEFIKFCIVGIICTIIDVGIYYATLQMIGYRLAMISGFCVSISINYILNIFWSFKAQPTIKNAIGILSAQCFNILVVRMALMWIFINWVNMSEAMAYLPTLVISTLTNFIIIHFIVNRFTTVETESNKAN